MGRPLNKRLFGAPTAGGNEIKCDFHNGTAVTEGFIVRQKGSKKFVVKAVGNNTEYTVKLATGKLMSNLVAGEMGITMLMDDSETYQVSKISGRKVTLVAPDGTGNNAYNGKSVPWNFTVSTNDGAAQVEEAGNATAIAVTAAVAGTRYVIVSAGNTDFTAIGSADSDVGTEFTATGAGTGTGTVRDIGDNFANA